MLSRCLAVTSIRYGSHIVNPFSLNETLQSPSFRHLPPKSSYCNLNTVTGIDYAAQAERNEVKLIKHLENLQFEGPHTLKTRLGITKVIYALWRGNETFDFDIRVDSESLELFLEFLTCLEVRYGRRASYTVDQIPEMHFKRVHGQVKDQL